MAFSVVLYTNTNADDHLTPSLGTGLSFDNCVLKHEADVDAVTLEIQTETNLAGYNYAFVSRYGRYYWVRVRSVRYGLWELTMESDPLATFRTELLNLRGTVDRAETLYNGYLNDPNYQALAPLEYTFKEFPNGLTDDALILVTVG